MVEANLVKSFFERFKGLSHLYLASANLERLNQDPRQSLGLAAGVDIQAAVLEQPRLFNFRGAEMDISSALVENIRAFPIQVNGVAPTLVRIMFIGPSPEGFGSQAHPQGPEEA